MTERLSFTLTIRDVGKPGQRPDGWERLKLVLKRLLRVYQYRCTDIKQIQGDTPPPASY